MGLTEMILTKNKLRLLIKESIQKNLLIEGVADTVARSVGLIDPMRIEQLRIASEKPHKLQKPDLMWIARFFMSDEGKNSQEPIEDIVSHIKEFKRSKTKIKRVGGETNIEKYKTPTELTIASTYSEGRLHEDDPRLEREARKILEIDDWQVWLPLSREASCTLGANTAWCTALSGKGNNLFYNYVLREGVILYYVIYKGQKEILPAHKKLALGAAHGKIYFAEKEGQGDGFITVDTHNKGITKNRFEKIILSVASASTPGAIIDSIEKNVGKHGGIHPTESKIKELLQSPLKFANENRGKSKDVILDFISTALEYAVSREILIPPETIKVIQTIGAVTEKDGIKYKDKAPEKLFDILDMVQSANNAYEEFNYIEGDNRYPAVLIEMPKEFQKICFDSFGVALWRHLYERLMKWSKTTYGFETWQEVIELESKNPDPDSWNYLLADDLMYDSDSILYRYLYDDRYGFKNNMQLSNYIRREFAELGVLIYGNRRYVGEEDTYQNSTIFNDDYLFIILEPDDAVSML